MKTLYEAQRMRPDEAMALTVESLQAYGPRHEHWGIAWSGGKDSTALLTLVLYLLETGQVKRPKSLTVLYADTRMEIPPLAVAAAEIIEDLKRRGIDIRVVRCDLDHRFFVYMLGRGVPPAAPGFRWCTGQIKISPMNREMARLHGEVGGAGKLLVLTGVRVGESAARDDRIALACGRDGAECGQGWYHETLSGEMATTLAPILHWRVCHIWHWLRDLAPTAKYGDWWATRHIAEAYGGDEAEELNCRTGCICCPVASHDRALEVTIRWPQWRHLKPLLDLRALYDELRSKRSRVRKPYGERDAAGNLVKKQARYGPLTLDRREAALARILDIQARVNAEAKLNGGAPIDILNGEEEARIRELIAAGTWPDKWTGNEPSGEAALFLDGNVLWQELCS